MLNREASLSVRNALPRTTSHDRKSKEASIDTWIELNWQTGSLQGTSVAVVDKATGVAVSITTKPENVVELRKHVEQMAAMHSGQTSSPAMMQGQMMPATVKYETIENGAKLTLTPKDPAKLAEFRAQVRAHVEKMHKGQCSMMQEMMQGMMKGMMGGMGKTETKPEPKKNDVDHSAHHPEEKK